MRNLINKLARLAWGCTNCGATNPDNASTCHGCGGNW